MVTLRLTNKLQKMPGIDLTEQLKPTTSNLGDWYANLVSTYSGDLIVFLNEKTLLSVAIPIRESDRLLYQVIAAEAMDRADLSLSKAEYELSQMPCKPMNYRAPRDVIKEILV